MGEDSTSTKGKGKRGVKVLCQWCGAANPEGLEECLRCGSPLLVLSGGQANQQPLLPEEEEDLGKRLERLAGEFQEDVLERLTLQEKQLALVQEQVRQLQARLGELESSLAIVDAGLRALGQLLQRRQVLRESEFMAAWEREAASEAAKQEVVEDLAAQRDVILARAKTLGASALRSIQRAFDSAELLSAAGKVNQAIGKLFAALQRYPQHPELAKLVGELALQQGELDIAKKAFRLRVSLQPQDVDALVSLATLLADEGEEAQAEGLLQRAYQLAKASFLPPFALGALKLAQNQLPQARRLLRQALAREESPVAEFLLGLVELRLGRPGRAIQALQRASELAPDLEEAIYILGLAYLERGHTRKALACFQRVLQLDPQRLRYQEAVRFLLSQKPRPPLPEEVAQALEKAASASEEGQLHLAWEALQEATQASSHPSLEAAAALVASALGKEREALRRARWVLRQPVEGPVRVAAWTALLETLRAAGRYQALHKLAKKLWEQGESQLERALGAYELALGLAETKKDLTWAEELAHHALQLFPSELRPYAQSAVGRVYLAQERYQDALDYLQPAASAAPSPQILTQLGLALLGVGDAPGARQILQRARAEEGTDLKTDVLHHLLRVAWLSARRK